MKIHSMIKLASYEFKEIQRGLYTSIYQIPVIFKGYGLVNFTPIRVHNVLITSFDMHTNHSASDVPALRGSIFPYMYDSIGNEICKREDLRDFATIFKKFHAHIRVSKELRDGDVLLSSERLKKLL